MAWTLTEAAKYSEYQQLPGIVETIIEVGGEVLEKLKWELVTGEGKKWVRETTLPSANFVDVNEDLTESTGTGTEVTASLKRIIGQSDIDKFIRDTYTDINNAEALTLKNAIKSCVRKWNDAFIYGNSTTDTKSFDGLHALVSTSSSDPVMRFTMAASTTPAALSLSKLDQMLDAIEPERADFCLINKVIRRRLSAALRSSSVAGYVVMQPNEFGHVFDVYAGIPFGVTDYIVQTELCDSSGWFTAKTGGSSSSIFAIKTNSLLEGGLVGLMGNKKWEVERIDPLPDKNAVRYRVKWYCSLALGRYQSLARLGNISDAAVTA